MSDHEGMGLLREIYAIKWIFSHKVIVFSGKYLLIINVY